MKCNTIDRFVGVKTKKVGRPKKRNTKRIEHLERIIAEKDAELAHKQTVIENMVSGCEGMNDEERSEFLDDMASVALLKKFDAAGIDEIHFSQMMCEEKVFNKYSEMAEKYFLTAKVSDEEPKETELFQEVTRCFFSDCRTLRKIYNTIKSATNEKGGAE